MPIRPGTSTPAQSPGPRLYYATTHWIQALVVDKSDGSLWYKAYDQLNQASYYIPPEWMRILPAEELAPLSRKSREEEKHIEIILDRQILLAFEADRLVYMARTATGQTGLRNPHRLVPDLPQAAHRPTWPAEPTSFPCSTCPAYPGIPTSPITGVALHGTYWHNDFGHTHSHGCINMLPQAAKWVYRWTLPSRSARRALPLRARHGHAWSEFDRCGRNPGSHPL